MKKAILLALALALISAEPLASEFEITYYVVSKHIESKLDSTTEYNKNHNFIGFEYRTGKHGFACRRFVTATISSRT